MNNLSGKRYVKVVVGWPEGLGSEPTEANVSELYCFMFGVEGDSKVSVIAGNDVPEIVAGMGAWLNGSDWETVVKVLPEKFRPSLATDN